MKFFKHLFTLTVLTLSAWSMQAQGTISGKVTDAETGDDIIGATVLVKGSSSGTTTDIDGTYKLSAPAGDIAIVVSYIGYNNVEQVATVKNGQTTTLNFSISENSNLMDEVVVVGYGVQRKRDMVGNVARVDNVTDITGSSFENTLQGKAAGVNITQSSGVAGGGAVVRIRGVSSVSSSGEPLYVIDGVVLDVNNFVTGASGAQNYNPLSFLNPNDIEHIDILKDASATAIYGSRGANGVIIVTTKRGTQGKPRFTFSSRIGIDKETNRPDFMNSEQLLRARQIAWENDGHSGRAPLPDQNPDFLLQYDDITDTTGKVIDNDWIDRVLQTGIQQEYNLSASWANKWFGIYAGGGSSKTESYIIGNYMDRKSGRLNLDFTPVKGMKIGVTTSLSRVITQRPKEPWNGGGLGNAQTYALPFYPTGYGELIQNQLQHGNTDRVNELRADSTLWGGWFNINNNPYAINELWKNRVREMRSVNNFNFTYAPNDKLTVVAQANYEYGYYGNYYTEDMLLKRPNYIFTELPGGGFDTTSERRSNTRLDNKKINNYQAFGTIDYKFIDNEKHSLRAMIGSEYSVKGTKTLYHSFDVTNRNAGFIYSDGVPSGSDVDTIVGSYFDWRALGDNTKFLSFFGRINYDYKKKWLMQFTIRRDASSLFGKNRRWGNFPALGVGYVLSEEPFMKDNKVINFLKLKASYGRRGIVGGLSQDEQYETYNISGQYNGDSTFVQSKSPNPNIGWENNTMIDGGIEFGLFSDRLNGEITYYRGMTTDAFVNVNIQASSGMEDLTYMKNAGKILNEGLELSLTSNNISTKNFKWSTRVIGSYNRNKLVDNGGATPDALDGGFGDIRGIEGYPLAVDYKVPWLGINAETGRPMYLDGNGDTTLTPNLAFDRRPGVSLFSPWSFSLKNDFSYKNFDFSFMFYTSFGGYIYDDAGKRYNSIITNSNLLTEMLTESWTGPGDTDAKYPALTMDSRNWGWTKPDDNNSTLYTYKSDYIRLRNVTVGYNIPFASKKIQARVYIVGTNLLTFTKYPLWDPEVARDRENNQQRNIGGVNVTYLTPPQAKSVVFGVDVTF